MTRDQQLESCRQCSNRKFDPAQGLICGITGKPADFEGRCVNFQQDEAVTVEAPGAERFVPNFKKILSTSDADRAKLRSQQDIVYAIVGGAASALVGALVWAFITVTTQYQIGYMAIGVGLLVGFGVRYYGAGVDRHFGYVGAFFAFVGCGMGNLLSQVGFIADAESLGYFDTIALLSFDHIIDIFAETFSPIDVLFYGFAMYEGYKFSFRHISDDLMENLAAGKIVPPPFSQFRLPTVVVLFVGLSVAAFFISQGMSGVRTFYYESGPKRSSGEIVQGKEHGAWESWWENGNLQYQGFFVDGKQDSTWKFYDEEGVHYRTAVFNHGLQNGTWSDYFPSGKIWTTTHYVSGRMHGEWVAYFENGNVSQKGYYYLDMPDSTWEVYFEDGKLNSLATYKRSVASGRWTTWDAEGRKQLEVQYGEDGSQKILNMWNGTQSLVLGSNGTYELRYDNGTLAESGPVKGGDRTDRWKKFFIDGKPWEEGTYRDGQYYLVNAWSRDGHQLVKEGEGQYELSVDGDTVLLASGLITQGLKSGKWVTTVTSTDNVMQTSTFDRGKLEGPCVNYFDDGAVLIEGNFKGDVREGLWKWYFQNGQLETSITFSGGKKEGPQEFFDDEGEWSRTELYEKGELINIITNNP